MSQDELKEKLARACRQVQALEEEIGKVLVGQRQVVREAVVATLAGGCVLFEGAPGLGKTLFVRSLAQTLGGVFSRIQFTPDLMPADITGSNILVESEDGQKSFEFQRGPIFANVVLADEINRATPKTQSALLEAMQEHSVTVGGETRRIDGMFFVLATQNPLEMEGTYPLPEAQLDRFMFNVKIDYPTLEEEEKILTATTRGETAEPARLLNPKILLGMQRLVSSVAVSQYIIQYATRLVRATRPTDPSSPEFIRDLVDFGAGPRAGQYLVNGGKAFAAMDGRFSVSIEDVKAAAVPVLRKRVGANFQAQAEGMTTDKIVLKLLDTVPTPPIEKYAR